MSATKILVLVVYGVLAALAFTQAGSSLGIWSLRILVLLAAVHLVEVAVFYKACKAAGGSLPAHMLNVFLFGVIHMNELKGSNASS